MEEMTLEQRRALALAAARLRLQDENTAVPAPAEKPPEMPAAMRLLQNAAAGAVRGAGSIGATLLAGPEDLGAALRGRPSSISERTRAMDDVLGGFGADTDSMAYKGGKLGAEIAGTAGIGGGAANVLRALGVRSAPLLSAVETAGFRSGAAPTTMAGRAGDLALRSAAGGGVGALSAGLVEPENALTGAAFGGALPASMAVAGNVGKGVGSFLTGPAQSPQQQAAIKSAREAGFVIPPTQAKASLGNRILEGAAGKLTTAQNASAQNQSVAQELVRKALGLGDDVPLSVETLRSVRSQSSDAYQAIKQIGQMENDARFMRQLAGLKGAYEGAAKDFPELANPKLSNLLDSLNQPTFKASSAIDAIRILRDKADTAFTQGEKGTAVALRKAATAMEDLVERNLLRINADRALTSTLRAGGGADEIVAAGLKNPASKMLDNFRKARQTIAKTYTVEDVLNPVTGSIDIAKLGNMLKSGDFMSGELKRIGEFGAAFRKAGQTPEAMGSLPQWSPLDLYGSLGVGAAGGLLTGGPGALLGFAPPIARVAARNAVLSPFVQNRLLRESPNAIQQLLSDPATAQLLYRAAPVLAADQ